MGHNVKVSDHAVVRWLERAHEVDIEGLREEIARLVEPAVKVGAASITIGNVTFALSGSNVCTVLTSAMRAKKRKERQRRGMGKPRRVIEDRFMGRDE